MVGNESQLPTKKLLSNPWEMIIAAAIIATAPRRNVEHVLKTCPIAMGTWDNLWLFLTIPTPKRREWLKSGLKSSQNSSKIDLPFFLWLVGHFRNKSIFESEKCHQKPFFEVVNRAQEFHFPGTWSQKELSDHQLK